MDASRSAAPLDASSSTPPDAAPSLADFQALQAELTRTKAALANQEASLSVERRHAASHADALRRERLRHLETTSAVEAEEENMTNRLMKRLGDLKEEKMRLVTEVEAEEEFLTNTLTRKLEAVVKEKEVALEDKRLVEDAKVAQQKKSSEVVSSMEAEQELIVTRTRKQVESLMREKDELRRQVAGLSAARVEKNALQRQVKELQGHRDRLVREKVAISTSHECDEEKIVNTLRRQIDALMGERSELERTLERVVRATSSEDDSDASSDRDGVRRWLGTQTKRGHRVGSGSKDGAGGRGRSMRGPHSQAHSPMQANRGRALSADGKFSAKLEQMEQSGSASSSAVSTPRASRPSSAAVDEMPLKP